jgi:hypothetical protein
MKMINKEESFLATHSETVTSRPSTKRDKGITLGSPLWTTTTAKFHKISSIKKEMISNSLK